MNAVIEKRVDNLEELMAELIKAGKEAAERSKQADERSKQADERSKQADERLAAYIAESRQEMREFKAEMRALSAQADARLQQHITYSDQQMDKLSQRLEEIRIEARKESGELANKMGRLVEDAVYPGIAKIFTEITGLEATAIKESGIRIKKGGAKQREFDAVIISQEYVLINETKSTLKPENVEKFSQVMQEKIRDYFPEHADKKFIGVVSSLYVDQSIVNQGSNLGLYVLGFKSDLMDVLNPAEFKPTYF